MCIVNCVMPFILQDLHSDYTTVTLVTEPSHTLGYCHVPKVASSSWMLAFAKMNGLIKEKDKRKSGNGYHDPLQVL